MPTVVEILKANDPTNYYRGTVENMDNQVIYKSMENYAKQEAKEFAHYINTHFLGVGMDEYWEEYQKEKKRMAVGMQTHHELLKAKK